MPYDHGLLFQDGRPLKYDSGDFPASLDKLKELVGWDDFEAYRDAGRARGPQGRARHRLLRRGHGRGSLRGRAHHHRDLRARERRDRADHAGAGPPDGLRPDRGPGARGATRGRARHHRRHPQDGVCRRHVRLARCGHERQRHRPRHPQRQGQGPAHRGRRPRGGRGRPRDRQRRRAGQGRADHVDAAGHRCRAVEPVALRLRRRRQGRHTVRRNLRPRQAAGGRRRGAGPRGPGLLLPHPGDLRQRHARGHRRDRPGHRGDHESCATASSTTAGR